MNLFVSLIRKYLDVSKVWALMRALTLLIKRSEMNFFKRLNLFSPKFKASSWSLKFISFDFSPLTLHKMLFDINLPHVMGSVSPSKVDPDFYEMVSMED